MAATKHKTRAIKVGSSFIHVLNGCEGSLCSAQGLHKDRGVYHDTRDTGSWVPHYINRLETSLPRSRHLLQKRESSSVSHIARSAQLKTVLSRRLDHGQVAASLSVPSSFTPRIRSTTCLQFQSYSASGFRDLELSYSVQDFRKKTSKGKSNYELIDHIFES